VKIALVHSFYQSGLPSGENVAVELQAQALADLGHDVRIISRHTDTHLGQWHYPMAAAFTVATGRGPNPIEEIQAFEPDVVHIHNLFPNWSTHWVKDLGAPYVVTLHNFRLICPAGTLLRQGKFCDLCPTKGSQHSVANSCYRGSRVATLPLALSTKSRRPPMLLEHAAGIIFLSERSQSLFDSYGLGYVEKAKVIPNFVPEPEVSPMQNSRNNNSRWIFVGRLSEEKGIRELLNYWPRNQPLDVVGSGPLEYVCRTLVQGKDVQFLGQVTKEGVATLLSAAKGLVFPSLWPEVLPFVYLEAISRSCQVIAKTGNAVADDVIASQSGEVFNSFEDLPRTLREAESGRSKNSAKARKRFESRFAFGSWSTSIVEVYRKVQQGVPQAW